MKFSFFFLIIFLSNNLLAENISHKKLVHLFSQNQLIEKSILDSKIDEEYLFRTIINLEKATKQVSRSWQNEIFKGPFIQLSPAYLNKKSIRVLYYKGKITAFYALENYALELKKRLMHKANAGNNDNIIFMSEHPSTKK